MSVDTQGGEIMEKCKKDVWEGYHSHRCTRNAVKDGYCKQHHPASVKEREEKSTKAYQEKMENSPWRLLVKAQARIAALEREICALRQEGRQWALQNGGQR
jgi:hypothetical protein